MNTEPSMIVCVKCGYQHEPDKECGKCHPVKTMFGWDMDKNLGDFTSLVTNLIAEQQSSRAECVQYLIERCKIAEAESKSWKLVAEERKETIERLVYECESCKKLKALEAKVKELEEKYKGVVNK